MNGITLLPTLNRIDKLRECLNSLKDAGTTTPGMVIVDAKDFEANGSKYLELRESHFLPNWSLSVVESVTMGDKIREVWPEVEKYDWVNILNDDHFVVTKEWDKRLSSQITGFNMISCSDRWMAPARVAGATMISMGLIKAWGFPIFPPGLKHLFIDDLLMQLAVYTGCWEVDMSVVIEHRHVLKREGKMDQTHQKTYHFGWEKGSDFEVFQKFMKEDFQGVVDRTKEYLKKMPRPDLRPKVGA